VAVVALLAPDASEAAARAAAAQDASLRERPARLPAAPMQ
jgi:hypothetical protein